MKKVLLLISVFLVSITLFSQKQNSIKYIEINYLDGSNISYDEYQRINSLVGIKILNVNKKLVDINNSVERTSYNQTVPKLFETFSNAAIPDGSSDDNVSAFEDGRKFITIDEIENLSISEKTKNRLLELISTQKTIRRKISQIEGSLKSYGIDYRRVKTILDYQGDILRIQEICKMEFDSIVKVLNNKTQSTFFEESTGISEQDRLLLDDEYRQATGKESFDNNAKYVEYKGILVRLMAKIINESETHQKSLTNNLLPSNIDIIKTEIKEFNKELKGFIEDFKKVNQNNETKKNLSNYLVSNSLNFELLDLIYRIELLDLEKIKQEFDSFKTTGQSDLLKTYEYFNESNYTYYLPPESINEDLTLLKIEITPKENVPCAPEQKVYEFRIKPKGGFKIDFSTGLFGNFGGNDFLDQSYSYEPIEGEPDNSKIVKNDSKNSILPSVGALMHIYPRQNSDVQWAGVFGISTTELESVNYHFGASAIIGYSTRFIISGGITLSKADLITDSFEVGQVLETSNAPSDIPTDSFNRFGYFISFTYNLSK